MAQIKYTDEAGLKYALMQFLAKADLRFLGIDDNAKSASKLEVGKTINGVLFDGTQNITITADPNSHSHNAKDIEDLNTAINNAITGAGGTSHTHSNLSVLEKITELKLTTWDAKIGANDVENLNYTNANMSAVTNVKEGLDTIVVNVTGLVSNINDINNTNTGILAQAKQYTNQQIALQTHLSFKIVATNLPTENISTSTIYLKPISGGTSPGAYEEYIYINGAWEMIGTTKTDLTDYYTKEEVNTLLNNKVDKVEGMGLSQESFTTTEKTKLASIDTITKTDIDTIIAEVFPNRE